MESEPPGGVLRSDGKRQRHREGQADDQRAIIPERRGTIALSHGSGLRLVGAVEDQVTVQEDKKRLTLPDGDRRGDVHAAAEDLERHIRELLAHRAGGNLPRGGCGENAGLTWLTQLRAGTDRGEKERVAEDSPVVVVDPVGRTALALRVLERESRQRETPPVREDEAGP